MLNPYGMSVNSFAWWKASIGCLNGSGSPAAIGDTIAQVVSQDGNTATLTQATAGDRPKLVTSTANGLPAMQFSSFTPTMGLDIPAGFTVGGQDVTVIIACRGLSGTGGPGGGAGLVELGSFAFYTKPGLLGVNVFGTDSVPTPPSCISENPAIYAYRSNATNLKFYADGAYSTAAALGAGNQTGGTIGNISDQFAFTGEMYEILVFPALSDTDLTLAISGMAAAWRVTVPRSLLVVGVESNIAGMFGNTPDPYGFSVLSQAMVAGALPSTMKLVNNGRGGEAISDALAAVTTYTGLINTAIFGQTGNIVAFTGMGNDFIQGSDIPTTEANILALGRAIRNAGMIPVFVQPPTVGPSAALSPTVKANIVTVSAWAAANWPQFANGYVPLPAALSDPTNTTYFQTDQIHFTTVGLAIWGAAMAAVVSKVLTGYSVSGSGNTGRTH